MQKGEEIRGHKKQWCNEKKNHEQEQVNNSLTARVSSKMATLMERVQKVVEKEFSPKEILLESARHGMVDGWIISKSFDGLSDLERPSNLPVKKIPSSVGRKQGALETVWRTDAVCL